MNINTINEEEIIKRLQTLIHELVENAQSGHPGSAHSLVPLFYTLYAKNILQFDCKNSRYPNRDLLILSNGHTCIILYLFLHLQGFISYTDLVDFRKLGSNTPGHPENETKGVECCTGPLGQGLANAVGFSLSSKKLKATFDNIENYTFDKKDNIDQINEINLFNSKEKMNNEDSSVAENNKLDCIKSPFPVIKLDNAVFCIFGDGCYQEGISHEAFSFAGHYQLNNLIFIYDFNCISIDGSISLSMSDNVVKRFEAYNFDIRICDANDCTTIEKILKGKLKTIRAVSYINNPNDSFIEKDKQEISSSNLYRNFEPSSFSMKKPLVLILQSKIADGTLLEGSAKTHGAPLGRAVIDDFKNKNNIADQKLEIPQEIYGMFENVNQLNSNKASFWYKSVENSMNLGVKKVKNFYLKKFLIPETKYFYTIDSDEVFDSFLKYKNTKNSTRKEMHNALEEFMSIDDSCIIGSADLTPSCLTKNKYCYDIIEIEKNDEGAVYKDHSNTKKHKNDAGKESIICKNFDFDKMYKEKHTVNFQGNHIHYGIREHAMFGITNGISLHGFFLPISSTFLNFITYGWHGIRLSALSHTRNIFIATHDSITLGEDGPTHQPIEVLSLLRSTPNLITFRPCDGNEVRSAINFALQNDGPTVICLTRLDIQPIETTSIEKYLSAYNIVFKKHKLTDNNLSSKDKLKITKIDHRSDVEDGSKLQKPEITILATGSEVSLAIEASKLLPQSVQIISINSLELFDKNYKQIKNGILSGFVVSLEAASTFGWYKYAHLPIGIDIFGKSGKSADVYKFFGFDPSTIAYKISDSFIEYLARKE
ncbi:hypothetical protein EDEG_00409 [Edhazardia aedis USNM 41457]|uniref:Transketolase-like pyrimidine-binding domain-containing protein n=1 Tax=Edhazardia aedis (strain USNM 41457) TaxID=1003232 RepID=J9D1Z2_EDHAE|nr:hypothetical protein EDEG_00409 [Edhazardia aedis USNM 41457]|eukprot:EJW01594.1 hypothetical protein EDEG_00409 [Edhazardia aedis USNM 41457]